MKKPAALEGLDLSVLPERERRALEGSLTSSSLAWPMALICAALGFLTLFLLREAGGLEGEGAGKVALRMVGYVLLGFWARSWSIVAAFLLLAWHLAGTYHYLASGRIELKIHFWIPALVFVWCLLRALGRWAMITKVQELHAAASTAEEDDGEA